MQTCLKSSWSQLLLCIRFSTYLHFREFIVLSSGSASNSDESSSTREVSAIWDAATFLTFHLIINTDLSFIFNALLSQSCFQEANRGKVCKKEKEGESERGRGGERGRRSARGRMKEERSHSRGRGGGRQKTGEGERVQNRWEWITPKY